MSESDEIKDHTVRNDNIHDKEVQEAIEEMERLQKVLKFQKNFNTMNFLNIFLNFFIASY